MTTIVRDVIRTVRAWPIFAFYIAATLIVATIIGLITVNIIDLGMQHFGEAAHRSHDVAYGALFTTLVVGVVVQLRHPERNVAGMVMALIPSASLLLAAVLVDDIDRVFEFNPLRYAAAVASVTVLLHPSGRGFFRSFRLTAVSWPMLAVVAVAAIPLLSFASDNIALQRDVTDMHTFMGHYGFMAALAYTIIAVGALASMRPAGWRLTVWVAALLAAVLGATSLLYPDAASSLATEWALASLAWAAAFAALAVRSHDAPTTTAPAAPSEPAHLAHAG
ncbi:MAG: hypothetical protein ACRDZZ_07295 [Ilumatobacteraceae bacterium]